MRKGDYKPAAKSYLKVQADPWSLPMEPLRQIILGWAEKYETTKVPVVNTRHPDSVGIRSSRPALNPTTILAHQVGVNERTMFRLLNENVSVSFDLADALVCAMNLEHEWIDGRLAAYYPDARGDITVRPRCAATTAGGKPCRQRPANGGSTCPKHTLKRAA